MLRRIVGVLLFGLAGVAILLKLGFWQIDRLEQASRERGRIEGKLQAEPAEVPDRHQYPGDRYLRVAAKGSIVEGEVHVYTSVPGEGVGYRVIVPFVLEEDDHRVLLDRGFVPIEEKDAPRLVGPIAVEGFLDWPADGIASPPDREDNVWIDRYVPALARELDTEPMLIVAQWSDDPDQPLPIPLQIATPHRHLEYALTWFGLAAVWALMTGYWLWRIKRRIE